MQRPIPVIVEDLINKVISQAIHYEQKQHYVRTLEDIRDEADKAIKIYEKQRNSFRK